MRNNYFTLFLLILFFFRPAASMFAADDLVAKAFDEAKSYYLVKDYEKAYSRIKFVMRTYTHGEEIPVEVKFQAEKIYYDYLSKLYREKSEADFEKIINEDQFFSLLTKESSRLLDLKTRYDQDRRLKIQKEQEEQFKRELEDLKKRQSDEVKMQMEAQQERERNQLEAQKIENEKFIKLQEQLSKEKMELEKKTSEQFSKMLESTIKSREAESKNSSKNIMLLVIFLTFIFLLLFVLFFIIIFVFMKHSQKQQERMFEFSIKTIQPPTTNILTLPVMPGGMIDMPQRLLSNTSNVVEIQGEEAEAPAPANDVNLKIKRMIETCMSYTDAIDSITNRKNCSKNVAELVFKMSKEFGYDEVTCMLHFAASLVHDIGFLDVDTELLAKEKISRDEFEILKTHTTLGLGMIDFVEDEFKPLFKDAISKHHENLDGTGYPRGLFSDQIPYIAKVIRVAESYISLISSRIYKEIKDKETAVKELYSYKNLYDTRIVEALEKQI